MLDELAAIAPTVFPEVVEIRGGVYEHFVRRLVEDDWSGMHDEYLVVGGAGTGKTSGLGFFIHGFARRFPGTQILVMREKRVDLNDSWMETFESEILEPHSALDRFVANNGGRKRPVRESRRQYIYPPDAKTGKQTRIVLGGMDRWERLRSTRWDLIMLVEATEFSKENIEGIQRSMRPARKRARERRAQSPEMPRVLIMETNPDGPEHPLRKRADRGVCFEILTTVKDNPAFWNRIRNDYEEEGRRYIDRMTRAMSGHVLQRLVHGIWAGAVGGVFEMFSRASHVINASVERGFPGEPDRIVFAQAHPVLGESVEIAYYVGGYDQGIRNAASLQVWAIDMAERSYLVHEVYEPGRGIEWWAEQVVAAYEDFPMRAIACDHHWYSINRFNDELHKANVRQFGTYDPNVYVIPESLEESRLAQMMTRDSVHSSTLVGGRLRIATNAHKSSGSKADLTNLELLRRQMMPGQDGAPRLMVLSTALKGTRPVSLDQDRPWGFCEEAERAVWAKYRESANAAVPKDAIDISCDDHALDAAAYMHAWAYGRGTIKPKAPQVRAAKRGSWAWHEERYDMEQERARRAGMDEEW